ncbi:phosphoribosylanthranilate isomerase [Kiloniella laminariae]|uniref:N-(5'-phosphoribosyl)anthranilate isomerase n=1 Tax=Kiloniella laminariae TaxID=454162 RepID=A0ABT4LJY6_9PROT|nr:phosphoribosylanthranilate isomerase [Kiloniella laminariae]MCZ4281387.1 phosphoribosylanthranilate isomerase [Kiloniella laminariae]
MATEVKICGINSDLALTSAQAAGASYLGFVFFPKSPRNVSIDQAVPLARQVRPGIKRVGLLVDASDEEIREILKQVPLDILQLHGSETPERVAGIKNRFKLQVMKVIKISDREDFNTIPPFEELADYLLFDAKPPKDLKNALPGGNAHAFDWRLLAGRNWSKPWMLAGGLTSQNVANAVRISGAPAVDVSSGVEDSPGVKSPEKIKLFIQQAKGC